MLNKLKSTVLASRAPGTSLNYTRVFNRRRSFATEVLGIVAVGAFHLVKNSENSGSGLNGNVFSVRLTGKFPEKVEQLKR